MALTVQNSSPGTPLNGTIFWQGGDGNVYYKAKDGTVKNMGAATGTSTTANLVLNGAKEISDPNPNPGAAGGGGGGSSLAAASAPVDTDAPERARLKGDIQARSGDIDSIYNGLFGDVDNLLRARDQELTTQYTGQRGKASESYTEALPQIDQSYAALGSYDSTQRGDSRGKAKKGYEDTLTTIGSNEGADKAKLGQYGSEQKAKISADRDSARRNVNRVGETNDVGALRSMRNDLETNLSTAGVTKATLGTDGQARQQLTSVTGDGGRADETLTALDSVLKSSLGSDVKAAAVKAVVDSSGLSDEDKKKVQETYGNVYAEQSAL